MPINYDVEYPKLRLKYGKALNFINELEAKVAALEALIQRVTIAANEMYHDNRKGDFELSTLARIDLDCILAALKQEDAVQFDSRLHRRISKEETYRLHRRISKEET